MKRCPNCNRTYTDQALSFCLHDGTPLMEADAAPSAYDPNATVPLPGSRYANPPQVSHRQDTPSVNQMRPSTAWSPMPGPPQPRRSVWPWIIGGVAILGFMGLGVLILVLALASMNTNHNANTRLTDRNANQWNANVNSTKASFTDDFSTQTWGVGSYSFGTAWYKDDEYHMHANPGGYIAMYAPNQSYQTENARVRVTARSVDAVSPTAGYGLLIHSGRSKESRAIGNYAFLIRTGDTPEFQVVHNRDGKKYTVKEWAKSPYIRSGSSPNQLEVVTKESLITFYINGHEMTTLTGMPDSLRGIAGFYTTDASEVAFDDLEIIR